MVLPVILAVIALAYIGIALVVARMCSINSRWEDLIDRIPNPKISQKVKTTLLPGEDNLLDDEQAPSHT
jgi:hypothetical protein